MIGFPIDSRVVYDADGTPSYDRAITSEPYRKLLKELFKTGVLPTVSTNMQVVAGDGMNVTVMAGFAMVEGCMKLEESNKTLTLEASDTTYSRIDTVVLRLDDNEDVRSCEYAIIKGTPASNPVAPELVRSNSIYDIGLANITVTANSTQVSASKITDTRYNSARCGVMSSISEFDTTTLYNQIQADLDEFKETYEAEMSEWTLEQQTAFVQWFDTIRDILDENVAGHLQNEIDALNAKVDNIQLVHLIVSYPVELAGNNITATNGTETHTVVASASGKSVIDGMKLGTWVISATYEDVESTTSVSTTFYGNYTAELKLSGRYDYQGWLDSAGITTTFASLEAVLADEKTLRILMTKHDSADYLTEWCESDEEVAEQILGTDLVAKWVNLRDYCLDKLYSVASVKAIMDSIGKYGFGEWVLKALVPTMTSNTAPSGECIGINAYDSGHTYFRAFDNSTSTTWSTTVGTTVGAWVGYDFGVDTVVNEVSITPQGSNYPSKIKVQGKSGDTWVDVNNKTYDCVGGEVNRFALGNTTPYKAYRIYVLEYTGTSNNVNVQEVQFLAWTSKGLVPTMTSNSAPYGEAIAWKKSGTSGGEAYYVFDNNSSTNFDPSQSSTGSLTSNYWGYKFTNPSNVKAISLTEKVDEYDKLYRAEIQYSNDNSTWVTVKEHDFTNNAQGTPHRIECDNNVYALYWRVHALTSKNSNRILVTTLQFYGRTLSVSVPKMESNTSPWGEAFVGDSSTDANYPYNGDVSTYGAWTTSWNKVLSIYKFPIKNVAKTIALYGRMTGGAGTQSNYTIKVEGSNDGTQYTQIGNNLVLNEGYKWISFNMNNDVEYQYYRFTAISGSMAPDTGSGYKINIFALDYSEHTERHYIYDNGVEVESIVDVKLDNYSTLTRESSQLRKVTKNNGSNSTDSGFACKLDLTPYKLVRFKIGLDSYWYSSTGASANADWRGQVDFRRNITTLGSRLGYVGFSTTDAPYNIKADISSYSEELYIKVGGVSGGDTVDQNLTIAEWWLE